VNRFKGNHSYESSVLVKSKSVKNASLNYETVEVLGIPVHAVRRKDLSALLTYFLQKGQRGWFAYVNVHAVNIAQGQEWLQKFFQKALVSYCDGAGIRLGAWVTGKKLPERIALTDWIYDICTVAIELKKKVFLLGAKQETIEKAGEILKRKYSQLNIVGVHHGYFIPDKKNTLPKLIRKSNADILIVGMGMPLQERWILDNFEKTNVQIAFDAGGVFDFIAGEKTRCPKWMGDAGLEWLFRLVLEPQRLWRRYLIGNPLFIYRIMKARFLRKS
jgi:N-acetylglucosaminyldiphosphoundecaprenol N-acetyl-beta-D-mannosaminyltransferase